MVLDLVKKVKDAELGGRKIVDDAKAQADAMAKRARGEGEKLLEEKREELKSKVRDIVEKYEKDARSETSRLEAEGAREGESLKKAAQEKVEEAVEFILKRILGKQEVEREGVWR